MGNTPSLLPPIKANSVFETQNYSSWSFRTYTEYLKAMEQFTNSLTRHLPKIKIYFPTKSQIEDSYFDYLDPDLNTEKLFNTSMSVYHKIMSVYLNLTPYPKDELYKINFPLLAKYLAYNYENEEENTLIAEKMIKRTNYLSEEFPFKLFHIINIIKYNCAYIYGYDKNFTLNFYIEHFLAGYGNKISYTDYIIYITFIIEVILPCLRKNKMMFNNKLNIIINFNQAEPNTELISILMTYMTNYFPLMLSQMHIVNYDLQKLKENMTFIDNLEKMDFFRVIFFHSNKTFSTVLAKSINVNILPESLGGNAKITPFNLNESGDIMTQISTYLIKNIFCGLK